ncbi:phage scaffolding protein [Listeria monocytogenes]
MDWLKEILGEELFAQFTEKVNAWNGNEANKENQVKIGNLGKGEYIGKGKYEALETEHNSKLAELTAANKMIEDFKKANKGNEEMQGKITAYESEVANLKAQLAKAQVDSAIKVALLEAKASDIDYMTFKLKESGELSLGEDGKVKGLDEKITSLKTQYPNHFESSTQKKILPNKLPNDQGDRHTEPETLADAIKQELEANN